MAQNGAFHAHGKVTRCSSRGVRKNRTPLKSDACGRGVRKNRTPLVLPLPDGFVCKFHAIAVEMELPSLKALFLYEHTFSTRIQKRRKWFVSYAIGNESEPTGAPQVFFPRYSHGKVTKCCMSVFLYVGLAARRRQSQYIKLGKCSTSPM